MFVWSGLLGYICVLMHRERLRTQSHNLMYLPYLVATHCWCRRRALLKSLFLEEGLKEEARIERTVNGRPCHKNCLHAFPPILCWYLAVGGHVVKLLSNVVIDLWGEIRVRKKDIWELVSRSRLKYTRRCPSMHVSHLAGSKLVLESIQAAWNVLQFLFIGLRMCESP